MLIQLKKILVVVTVALLSACGGGGGGSGSNTTGSASSVVNCVTTQTLGCQFNATDPTQSSYGWWIGTRTVDTGTAPAYLAVNNLNNYTFYVGDDFNGGEISGSISAIGSTISSISGSGFDAIAGFRPLGSVSISAGSGGVVSNSILSYTSGIFYNLSKTFSMKYTYNNVGDQTLSQNVGAYTDGNGSSLVITSEGNITASYKSLGVATRFVLTTCVLSQQKPANTKLKDLFISGTDSCGINNSIGFYSYINSSNLKKIVLRMRSTADQLTPIVLQ